MESGQFYREYVHIVITVQNKAQTTKAREYIVENKIPN